MKSILNKEINLLNAKTSSSKINVLKILLKKESIKTIYISKNN